MNISMNYGFWNDSHEQNIINLTRHSRISSGKADPKVSLRYFDKTTTID